MIEDYWQITLISRLSKKHVLILTLLLLWITACTAQHAGPRYVIYYNSDASPASDLIGLPYTHVILSFVTLDLTDDETLELAINPHLETPLQIVHRLQADDKKVLISFGGGDMTLEAYQKAVGKELELARKLAELVDLHGLDGVDLDFELTETLTHPPRDGTFDGKAFLIALTQALRQTLPEDALITHAPQAPYLDPGWHQGPYLHILKQTGQAIDWITVQYYNNPDFDLPVASHLVGDQHNPFPASYAGIVSADSGLEWPVEKTLVGLPVYSADAVNGHLAPDVVRTQVLNPLVQRFGHRFGGLTGWQFSTHTHDHQYWNDQLSTALHADPQ